MGIESKFYAITDGCEDGFLCLMQTNADEQTIEKTLNNVYYANQKLWHSDEEKYTKNVVNELVKQGFYAKFLHCKMASPGIGVY